MSTGNEYPTPWLDDEEIEDGLLRGEICELHHIEKSLTGECWTCEDERKIDYVK